MNRGIMYLYGWDENNNKFKIVSGKEGYKVRGNKVYTLDGDGVLKDLVKNHDDVDIQFECDKISSIYRVIKWKNNRVVLEKAKKHFTPKTNRKKILSLYICFADTGLFMPEYFTKYEFDDNNIKVKIKDKYNLEIFKWYYERNEWFFLDYYEWDKGHKYLKDGRVGYLVEEINGKNIWLKRFCPVEEEEENRD